MRLTSWAVLALSLAVISGGSLGASAWRKTQSSASVTAGVLFDLGDGDYYWSSLSVLNPATANATWDAVQAAASSLGLSIRWTWYSCCGIAISDIGNMNPPAGFVGIYIWNATTHWWNVSPFGVSSLVLTQGESIAFYDAAFDSVTYEQRYPVPTPDDAYPVTQFRNDVTNKGRSISDAPDSLNILWDRFTGSTEIDSTPAAAFGLVFVSTMDGLMALKASDGTPVWAYPKVKSMSSPTVYDGSILIGADDGKIYRVNATSGVEIWNATLINVTRFCGITSSPKVWYDTVYIGVFNESGGPGAVEAFWVSNGTPRWSFKTASIDYSSPAIVNGNLYVGVMGMYNTTTAITFDPPYGILALNASTGSELWFFPTSGSVAASPLVYGSVLMVPSKDGSLYAVTMQGALAWKASVDAGVSSAASGDGLIFVGGGSFGAAGGRVTALAPDGTIMWHFTPNGPVQASLQFADNKVYFSTNVANGTLYALNATNGDIIWERELMPPQFILGSPVVADGRLYTPSDNGHIYAFADPAPALIALNVTARSPFQAGSGPEVDLTVKDIAGSTSRTSIELELPAPLVFSNATPSPTSRSGSTYVWDIGAIPFGEEREVRVNAEIPANVEQSQSFKLTASANYSDADGAAYPEATNSTSVAVTGVPPPASNAVVAYVVGLLIAVLVVVVVLLLRRRGRQPPST